MLRKQMKHRVSKLSTESLINQGRLTAETIIKLPEFKNAHTVGLYMNLPSGELPTEDIIKECFKYEKDVYLPRVTPLSKFNDEKRFEHQNSVLRFLKIEDLKEAESMPERGKYKIREPEFKEDSQGDVTNDLFSTANKLDILFVPGLAFSKDCKRLGHGAGFYDDFIKRYYEKYHEKPLLIGLGLKEQLLDRARGETLHIEEHDEPLQCVVLADTIYRNN